MNAIVIDAASANGSDLQFQDPASAGSAINQAPLENNKVMQTALSLRDWIQLANLDTTLSLAAAAADADANNIDSATAVGGTASSAVGLSSNSNNDGSASSTSQRKNMNGEQIENLPFLSKLDDNHSKHRREARKTYASYCLVLTKIIIDRLVLNQSEENEQTYANGNDSILPRDISMDNLMVEMIHNEDESILAGFNGVTDFEDFIDHSNCNGHRDVVNEKMNLQNDVKLLSIAKILKNCSSNQIRQIVGSVRRVNFISPSSREKRGLCSTEELSDCYYEQLGLILFELFTRGSIPTDFINFEDYIGFESEGLPRGMTGGRNDSLLEGHNIHDVEETLQESRNESGGNNDEVIPNPPQRERKFHSLSQACKTMRRMNLSCLQEELQTHYIFPPISRLIADLMECRRLTISDGKFACLGDIQSEIYQMIKEPDIFLSEEVRTINANTKTLEFPKGLLYDRANDIQALHLAASISRIDSQSNINNVVFIRGDPGIGKSSLVNSLKEELVSNDGWLFFGCKFDRMAQNEPLSVMSSGLNSFLMQVANLKSRIEDDRLDNNNNLVEFLRADENYITTLLSSIERHLSASGIVFLSGIIPSLKMLFPAIFQSVVRDDDFISDDDREHGIDGNDYYDSFEEKNHIDPTNKSGGEITADENDEDEDASFDANTFKNRVHYLFRRLLRAISLPWNQPIFFFVDDLQWAYSASLALLSSLVIEHDHIDESDEDVLGIPQCLMVVGSYRANEVDSKHLLNHCIEVFQISSSVHVTNLNLGGLSRSGTNSMISDVLKLPIRLTRAFAHVVQTKSVGNPLFVKTFLTSLLDDHKLTYGLMERRWKWDIEAVRGTPIDENVATIYSRRIMRLPEAVVEALVVVSCFGTRVDNDVLDVLSCSDQFAAVIPSLKYAVQEGIIEKNDNNTYYFAHDTIQQTVYNLLPIENMKEYHFKIGLQLVKGSATSKGVNCNPTTFVAIDQINKAVKSIDVFALEPPMKEMLASLNLKAAECSIDRADALSALSYVHHGINYLGNDSWALSYETSLRLNEVACMASYLNASPVGVTKHFDEIMKHAKGFEDKMKARYIFIQATASTGDIQSATNITLDILGSLGEHFPSQVTPEDIHSALTETKEMIKEDLSTIMQSSHLTDENKRWSLKFMDLLALYSFMLCPSFVPLIASRMVQISFRHGCSRESVSGLFCFSYSCISALKDIDEGYRWGKFALLVLDRFKASSLHPKIKCSISSFVTIWKEPFQSSVDVLRQCHQEALLVGDIEYATMSCKVCIQNCIISGNPLSVLEKECVSASQEMVGFVESLFQAIVVAIQFTPSPFCNEI